MINISDKRDDLAKHCPQVGETIKILVLNHVMRMKFFFHVKKKAQISFAVTAKLISAFVFATWIVDWPPSYVHYHPIIPCSITSINIFLYELPLFLGSEHSSQTQPSEILCMFF